MIGKAYVVECTGNRLLPPHLSGADAHEVEQVLRDVVAFLGWGSAEVTIERAASAFGCVPTVDFVAIVDGTPLVVARPSIY